MKIDTYGSVAAEPTPSPAVGVANTSISSSASHKAHRISTEDTTSFTSGTASVQTLTEAAFDTTSRAARVASLQQAVRSGQYTVDPARIAAALAKADV